MENREHGEHKPCHMDIKKTEHRHGICHHLGIVPPLKVLHKRKGIEQNHGK